MASPPNRRTDKIIVDPIHGDIHLRPLECRVIDTAPFQRLRHLKQLQFGHVTYPGATHTRFAHCIGVLGVMARITDIAREPLKLTDELVEDIRLAGLLHDVGHYPYSHLMEKIDSVQLTEEFLGGGTIAGSTANYQDHEEIGELIVTTQQDLIDAIGGPERVQRIADLFRRKVTANAQLSKLIHSSLDMDRLDFLLRDARAAGVPYGQIDLNYLLNNFDTSPMGVVGVKEKAITAVDHFLLGRFFMYRSVYYHKTTFGLEEACRQLLRRGRDAGKFDIPVDGDAVRALVQGTKLGTFTDAFVDRVIELAAEDSDPVTKALANSIRRRRPPKLLKEVLVLQRNDTTAHAGVLFKTNIKHQLARLAKNRNLPEGHFLVAETKPLTLEERGSQLSEHQLRKLKPEERQQIIKVFVTGQPEPVSVVDVPHSLLHICSNHFFQAFRLYLVPDENTDDVFVEHLRDEVRGWDRG
jgi:hypothetical protein